MKALPIPPLSTPPALNTSKVPESPKQTFHEVLQRADDFAQIKQLEKGMIQGKKLSVQELLSGQMIMQRFHLRIELCGKAGEAFAASIKKFQGGQG